MPVHTKKEKAKIIKKVRKQKKVPAKKRKGK